MRSGKVSVEFLGFRGHAQGVVIAANLDAFATALAKVADEDRKQPAGSRGLLFEGAKNGRHIGISQRKQIDNTNELAARFLGNGSQLINLVTNDILKWQLLAFFDGVVHANAGALLDALELIEQLLSFGGIADVINGRGAQDGSHILSSIGKGRVGTGRDAFHALSAVFGDV